MSYPDPSRNDSPPQGQYSPYERKCIVALFQRLIRRGTLDLVFSDTDVVQVGDNGEPHASMVPPRLPELIRILFSPGLFLGESFMAGRWSASGPGLAELLRLFYIQDKSTYMVAYQFLSKIKATRYFRKQILFPVQHRKNLVETYNVGNSLYEKMLGPDMHYTCAFFKDETESLELAQERKIVTTFERLDMDREGLRVLDIGCGWGEICRRLAREWNAETVGLTLSQQQFDWATAHTEPTIKDKVFFRLMDYRDYAPRAEGFDRILSIGMFEHVGRGQHRHFFETVKQLLRPGGIAVIHNIVRPTPAPINAWMDKYIFPNAYAPTIAEESDIIERSGLQVADIRVQDALSYSLTLRSWRNRFYDSWPVIGGDYDDKFFRMWEFYLAANEAGFRPDTCNMRICQFVIKRRDFWQR